MRMQIHTVGARCTRARNTAECFHRGHRTRRGKRRKRDRREKKMERRRYSETAFYFEMWRKRSASKKHVESVCGETKPRGNQNAKGKSWKLYDYLAVAAQVQALPPVLSHLELDPQENMSYSNRAGLSGKRSEIGSVFDHIRSSCIVVTLLYRPIVIYRLALITD